MNLWIILAGLNGFFAVAASALSAHGSAERLNPYALDLVRMAAYYQFGHALALIGVAWLAQARPGLLPKFCGLVFTLGILLFCGALYSIALSGTRLFAPAAPIGGMFLLLGWALFSLCGWRRFNTSLENGDKESTRAMPIRRQL